MNNPKHYSCCDESENEDLAFTLEKLSLLQPGQADAPRSATYALTRINRDIEASTRPFMPGIGGFLRSLLPMNNRRLATAVATLIFLFAVALTFPSVRAVASDFLSLFRVQKFAAVSVSPQQMAMLEQFAEQGMMPGEITMIQENSLPPVESLSEAAVVLGRDVKTIGSLGEPQGIFLNGESRMQFLVDLDSSRAILEAVGADPTLLPDSLDGQTIDGTVFASVHQHWPGGVHLAQMPSPQIVYPVGLQPQMLGEAMLQLLGMSPAEAARLSRDIDWTSTLILPVPQDMATFNEVVINGSSGLALSSLNSQENSLIWQQDGHIYLLTSQRHTPAELLRLAQSMQ
jgi:hypothetical protein